MHSFISFNLYEYICEYIGRCPDPGAWLYTVAAICALFGLACGVLGTLAVLEHKRTRAHRYNERGNVFTMIFAATAMVGVLGVAGMQTVMGPVSTMTKVTQHNLAENDLLMNAKVAVMNAATLPQGGDEDSDGYIEPAGFVPPSDPSCGITLPGQGGCLPADIGAIQTDPWGTQYGYCVWDQGSAHSSINRIDGEDSTSGAVLAVISTLSLIHI